MLVPKRPVYVVVPYSRLLHAVNMTCAILRVPGSPFGETLACRLDERGARGVVLNLDGPMRGEPVTVRSGSVLWQGVDLIAAAAVFVERPVFPWPQPGNVTDLIRDGAPDKDRVGAEREARSLIASAIPAAAVSGRLVNPPVAAHLSASPAIGLDLIESAGLAVHPWRLGPAPEDADGRLLLDSVGRDLWHEPERPLPGHIAIEPDRFSAEVLSVLIAGGSPLGGLRHADGPSWAAGENAGQIAGEKIPADVVELACRAVETLGLGFAAVSVIQKGDRPGLLWFDAGPDLAVWDLFLEGRVAAGIADYLIAVAAGDEGRRS